MVDVKKTVEKFLDKKNHSMVFQANNDNMEIDPCVGIFKKLELKYIKYEETDITIYVDEGSWVDIPEKKIEKIISARYGQDNVIQSLGGLFNPLGGGHVGYNQMVDVKKAVEKFLDKKNHSMYFQVNNDNMEIDPCVGILKLELSILIILQKIKKLILKTKILLILR